MTKQVLAVGNCAADFGALRRLIEARFDADLVPSHSRKEALDALRGQEFNLVLINRILDRDADDGIDLIRAIKADPDLAQTPVMLITNYPEHQRAAGECGALPGFGKSELNDRQTFEKLRSALE